MTLPTAERRERSLVLDRAPQATGTFEISALGREAREQADAEDAPGAIADPRRDLERLARIPLGLRRAAATQRAHRELGQHPLPPPRHAGFLSEACAFRDQLRS